MKKKIRWSALILAAAVGLSACSGTGSQTSATTAAPETTASAGSSAETTAAAVSETSSGEKILTIGTYMPVTTLVPWRTTSDGDGYIIRQIYHTLVEMNK